MDPYVMYQVHDFRHFVGQTIVRSIIDTIGKVMTRVNIFREEDKK
jgi:hypothetical protein